MASSVADAEPRPFSGGPDQSVSRLDPPPIRPPGGEWRHWNRHRSASKRGYRKGCKIKTIYHWPACSKASDELFNGIFTAARLAPLLVFHFLSFWHKTTDGKCTRSPACLERAPRPPQKAVKVSPRSAGRSAYSTAGGAIDRNELSGTASSNSISFFFIFQLT